MYSHFQDRTKKNDNIVFQEERPTLRSCIIANKFEETRTQTQNILKRKTDLKTSSKEIMHQQESYEFKNFKLSLLLLQKLFFLFTYHYNPKNKFFFLILS